MELLSDIQVIYVEDDEVDRHIFKLVLNKISVNSHVKFLENGEEFLDFYYRRNSYRNREPFQGKVIIFLDINMPRLNGLDVLKRLSESQSKVLEESFPPIIMFSASKREVDISESRRLGATDYVVKPFSYQEMQSSLKALFCRYLQSGKLKETSL
ncbi:response regulator [Candidatus Odyssella thessalonicensis]|uniref:response regulator n=1 Tax=Candidatus Odyssella thessalonicensis TaxID=84647 RepID=UPI000225B248|nr:response regulator [Candidatus Odyssella thessalonicensis]